MQEEPSNMKVIGHIHTETHNFNSKLSSNIPSFSLQLPGQWKRKRKLENSAKY